MVVHALKLSTHAILGIVYNMLVRVEPSVLTDFSFSPDFFDEEGDQKYKNNFVWPSRGGLLLCARTKCISFLPPNAMKNSPFLPTEGLWDVI
jgi:hypothetical protein